jgi:hypothetical protein
VDDVICQACVQVAKWSDEGSRKLEHCGIRTHKLRLWCKYSYGRKHTINGDVVHKIKRRRDQMCYFHSIHPEISPD